MEAPVATIRCKEAKKTTKLFGLSLFSPGIAANVKIKR
jgi:hypothetical protein